MSISSTAPSTSSAGSDQMSTADTDDDQTSSSSLAGNGQNPVASKTKFPRNWDPSTATPQAPWLRVLYDEPKPILPYAYTGNQPVRTRPSVVGNGQISSAANPSAGLKSSTGTAQVASNGQN